MTIRLRTVLAALALALVCLASALAVLPARWLMALLPASWPITVVDAGGTLWSGSATVAIGPQGRQRTLPAPLLWQTALLPTPRIEIRHPWLDGPLRLRIAGLGAALSAQSLQLPASTLSLLHDGIRILNPGGDLLLAWPATRLGLTPPAPGATLLELQWRNAASPLSPIRPLGHYLVTVTQGNGGQAAIALTTRQGPLQLEGNGTLSGNAFRFDGTGQAQPDAPADTQAALQELLAALGPIRNGQASLRFQ